MKSSIYTRTGDGGTTGLADGSRIPKHALRIEAYGTLDEANAHVGVVTALLSEQLQDSDSRTLLLQPLQKLQGALVYLSHRLFNCSSLLAHGSAVAPESLQVNGDDVANLERGIDFFDSQTGALKGFVLCGGVPIAAELHVARTVMRRAERAICRLYEEQHGDLMLLKFVNRASDFLFAAARYANFVLGESDVHWQRQVAFPEF